MNPIVAIVKKAVSWSVKPSKFTFFRAEIECTPTITRAQVVAASGMMPTNGCTNSSDNKKAAPVIMEATPVRALDVASDGVGADEGTKDQSQAIYAHPAVHSSHG